MFLQNKPKELTTQSNSKQFKDNDFNFQHNLVELKTTMELRKTSNLRTDLAFFQQNNKITAIKVQQKNVANDNYNNESDDNDEVDSEHSNKQDNNINYVVAGYGIQENEEANEKVNLQTNNKMLFNRISKTPIEIINLQDYNFSYVKKEQQQEIVKPNPTVAKQQQNAEDAVESIENSFDDHFHKAVGPSKLG